MLISNLLVYNQLLLKEKINTKVKAIDPYNAITLLYMVLTKKGEDSKKSRKQ